MLKKIIIISLLLFISGAADGVRDAVSFRYQETGFSKDSLFWNPKISWRNKWENGDPDQGEAFPGSSTVFVWATDAWHLFQTIMLSCFRIAMLVVASMFVRAKWWQWVLLFFAISAIWSSGFHLIFTIVF